MVIGEQVPAGQDILGLLESSNYAEFAVLVDKALFLGLHALFLFSCGNADAVVEVLH